MGSFLIFSKKCMKSVIVINPFKSHLKHIRMFVGLGFYLQ